MTIKFLKQTRYNGRLYSANAVITISDNEASVFISNGSALRYSAPIPSVTTSSRVQSGGSTTTINETNVFNTIPQEDVKDVPEDLIPLEYAMDKIHGLPIQVQLPKDLKQEIDGGLVLADMKGPYYWNSISTSQPFILDCTGYQSIIVHKISAGIITPTISNDNLNYAATNITNVSGLLPAAATLPAATGIYITPVQAKWFKLVGPASAVSCIIYLSQAPYILQPYLNIAGTNAIAGGIAGSLAVGGNVANAVAPTSNPIQIAGVDALKIPLTRRVLSDELGRVQISNVASQLTKGINTLGFDPTFRNVLEVQDTKQTEGQSVGEILLQVLVELKILNLQIHELPAMINLGLTASNNLEDYRNEITETIN